jgi:diguanylate cyclase (GGDEF)-like protein
MSDELELLRRRLEREKLSRKQAEQIAEEKSRELYIKSRDLEKALSAESRVKNEIETLLNALQAFTSKLDIPGIVEKIHHYLNQAVSNHITTLYLQTGGHIQAMSIQENSPEGRTFRIKDDLPSLEKMFQMGELKSPLVFERKQNDEHAEIYGMHADSHSMMVLQLSAQGQHLGFITAESHQSGAFYDSNIRFAQALANEASISLENAILFREVERLSMTDPLTGLNNRRSFDIAARQNVRVAIRHKRPLSVLMLDIDFFKRVNDTYGHAAGDKVLVKIAHVCQQHIRSTDLLARFGGEEFCFLLPETNAKSAHLLADHLRTAISAIGFEANGQSFSVTASVGISECSGEDDSLESLLERSDEALYSAKQAGRNCVVIWSVK